MRTVHRFLAFCLILLTFANEAHATLIVVIPSADGLVIAADSRVRSHENHALFCDQEFKIVEVIRPRHTVVLVTNVRKFYNLSQDEFPCPLPRPSFDLVALVKDYVESKNVTALKLPLKDLESVCASAIAAHAPNLLNRNQMISVVNILTYDASSRQVQKASFQLGVLPGTHWITPEGTMQEILSSADTPMDLILSFGDGELLSRDVFKGKGRKYLDFDTMRLNASKLAPSKVSKIVAVKAAINCIDAAIKTAADLSPTPTAGNPSVPDVGGPIDVLYLSAAPKAEKIRWKTP